MSLTCAHCERRWVRTVAGERCCIYHPGDAPPFIARGAIGVTAPVGRIRPDYSIRTRQ